MLRSSNNSRSSCAPRSSKSASKSSGLRASKSSSGSKDSSGQLAPGALVKAAKNYKDLGSKDEFALHVSSKDIRKRIKSIQNCFEGTPVTYLYIRSKLAETSWDTRLALREMLKENEDLKNDLICKDIIK